MDRCDVCAAERLVAFSCKGRGVCPSCNARRMVEVAARLTDLVLPPLPVRQWVLSVPKRIRLFLPRDPALAGAVLRILLHASADAKTAFGFPILKAEAFVNVHQLPGMVFITPPPI